MTATDLRNQLKLNLGISTSKQDERLDNLISSLISELKEVQGIDIDLSKLDHAIFIIDYATYRYSSVTDDMPRHLRFRLHNLFLKGAPNVGS